MEQLNYNLLLRWFVGLAIDDEVWDPTVFCKNRDRLLDGDTVLNLPQVRTPSEHFSVVNDGLKLVENQRSEIGGRRGLTG